MSDGRLKAAAFFAATCLCAALAIAMVPRAGIARMTGGQALETLFPPAFGSWKMAPGVLPIEPPEDVRESIAQTYDETLVRTYIDPSGYRVMLSVAYGGRRNQGMDIHRPEVCYPAQGFAIRSETVEDVLRFQGSSLPLKRLVAGAGQRNEPISYWLVIGDDVASFGYGHRIALLKYGLTGRVPDGMLVRVSSIDADAAAAFERQDGFLRAMLASLASGFRGRLLGQGT